MRDEVIAEIVSKVVELNQKTLETVLEIVNTYSTFDVCREDTDADKISALVEEERKKMAERRDRLNERKSGKSMEEFIVE